MTVTADFLFVNGIPFLVSVLRGVNFTTVEYVSQRLKTVRAYSIGKIFQFYRNKGNTIKTVLMDRDFEFIHESLPEEENVNTTTTNKHVPDIERNNRIIKKRARLPISTFPFKNITV